MTSNNRSNVRHEFIEDRLSALEAQDIISDWRYEKAAQRYLVTLGEELQVAGGAASTDTMIMTLMTAEAFLTGCMLMQRAGLAPQVFTVSPDGEVTARPARSPEEQPA